MNRPTSMDVHRTFAQIAVAPRYPTDVEPKHARAAHVFDDEVEQWLDVTPAGGHDPATVAWYTI